MFPCFLSTKTNKTNPANLTVLAPQTDKVKEKMCCIFPGSILELNQKSISYSENKMQNCSNPSSWKIFSKTKNMCGSEDNMGLKITCCTNVSNDILLPFPNYILYDYLVRWPNILLSVSEIYQLLRCMFIFMST